MPRLTMPNVGEGVTEGTVTRWIKRQGDDVALDEPVVEVETDKAVVEIPSPYAGRLAKILVDEGAVVPIGTPLAEFEAVGGPPPPAPSQTGGEGKAPKRGAAVAAVRESTTPAAGQSAADAADGARDQGAADAATQTSAPGSADGSGYRRTRQYSPVVLRLASEHGIDLALVQGTGIDGRVTRQDVTAYAANPVMHTVPPDAGAGVVGVSQPAAAQGAPETPRRQAEAVAEAGTGDERVPLTPTRRTIAARMLQSQQTVPPAWMMVEADVTALVALRARLKADFERSEGVALTYMPFFVQAISGALKQHPVINSSFGDGEIVVHHRYDIGIAVAVDSGLVVPVIRAADRKSIAGLAHELHELGAKARARKLTIEDMRGPTFTIDNTGSFGSIVSQPIVPPGQAAIITTEAVRRELRVAADGSFAVRAVMNLCISFDHRALDGAQAGAFMQAVRQRLEAYQADDLVS
ncbi:MAG: dihydrolipoamide acetyltransferase family protein [Dehalococcoidia bacterium]